MAPHFKANCSVTSTNIFFLLFFVYLGNKKMFATKFKDWNTQDHVCLADASPPTAQEHVCLPDASPPTAQDHVCLADASPPTAQEHVCLPDASPPTAQDHVCLADASPPTAQEHVCLPDASPPTAQDHVCLAVASPPTAQEHVCLPDASPQADILFMSFEAPKPCWWRLDLLYYDSVFIGILFSSLQRRFLHLFFDYPEDGVTKIVQIVYNK